MAFTDFFYKREGWRRLRRVFVVLVVALLLDGIFLRGNFFENVFEILPFEDSDGDPWDNELGLVFVISAWTILEVARWIVLGFGEQKET